MSDLKTELAQRMIARAHKDGLPKDHEMNVLAVKFEDAASGFYGSPQTVDVKTFMGHWARARRAWSNYTGESLV